MLHRNPTSPTVMVMHLTPEIAAMVFRKVMNLSLEKTLPGNIRRIVIKINLCDYRLAESGATTDPTLLKDLIIALRDVCGSIPITIIENNATSLDADSAFRFMGIHLVAKETGAELVNLAKSDWQTIAIPEGRRFQSVDIPSLLDSNTLYVNFAKMKINSGTIVTGCLKNNYGLLREKNKAMFHADLPAVINDINLALKKLDVQMLCIIDGLIAMETIGGPAFGRPKRCELLLACSDPVATDACEARIMGFNPKRVAHLRLCARSGIGSLRYKLKTDVKGDLYNDYRFRFERWQYWLRSKLKARAGIGA